MKFDKFHIGGVAVAAVDVFRARDLVGQLSAVAGGEYVTVTGAHGIVESAHDDRIREAHCRAAIVVADGMPLVWLGRLLGLRSVGRVNGPELMELIFAAREYRELRHFFYGATPLAIDKLRNELVSRFGEFNMVGMHSPPVRPLGFSEDDEVVSKIRSLRPNFIWVGLSTPKQEIWMDMHMAKIGTGVAIGVGAAFDLLSGNTLRAPRWIQRSGFEWLFRLTVEPRRLFKRYVFVIPRFVLLFVVASVKRGRCETEQNGQRQST
jgi:N-acetylglucosaminyldiphosphoundecaprenol N-acetyl-beta-D-mannosaminyltransferase